MAYFPKGSQCVFPTLRLGRKVGSSFVRQQLLVEDVALGEMGGLRGAGSWVGQARVALGLQRETTALSGV